MGNIDFSKVNSEMFRKAVGESKHRTAQRRDSKLLSRLSKELGQKSNYFDMTEWESVEEAVSVVLGTTCLEVSYDAFKLKDLWQQGGESPLAKRYKKLVKKHPDANAPFILCKLDQLKVWHIVGADISPDSLDCSEPTVTLTLADAEGSRIYVARLSQYINQKEK